MLDSASRWVGKYLFSKQRLTDVVRETFGTAVYFMTYESVKQLLVKYQSVSSPTSPLAVTLAGGFCGMIGLVSVREFWPQKKK
jgi:hypothetical protein